MDPETHHYEFGPYRIDSTERLLRRGDELISLPPKVIDTLLVLVSNSGRMVEKEALMQTVWPDITVEPNSIAKNVSLLRKTFGDTSDEPRYIETISKRGYRFVAIVRSSSAAVDERASPPVPPVLSYYKVAVAVLAVGLGLFLTWAYFHDRSLHSLVVLPLADLSPNPQDFFAKGMTEALLTNLAKIAALKVVSYAALKPEGSGKEAAAIAANAKVEAALEGSVLRAGDRVRITVRLLRAKSGEQIWAEQYGDSIGDILQLQAGVAQKIAEAIKVKVTPQEYVRLTPSRPVRSDAYTDYLMGRYYWNKRTTEAFKKAVEHFERCIQQDPGYAPAYAGLADAYSLLGSTSYDVLPPREAMPKAKTAALMAVKMDDGLAEAHASLAYILLAYDWDWPAAEREFRRALDLNPGYATAHHWYAHYLLAQGRMDLALREMRTALDREPLSLAINTGVGWCLYLERRYDQALEQYRKTLEMDSNFVLAHIMLGMAYERKGSYPEAIQAFQKALTIAPQSTFALARLGQTYAVSGDKREAGRILDHLNEMSKTRYVPAIYQGAIYVGLGDMDHAYQWADKAYADRSHYVIYFKVEPLLDRFRLDARFSEFNRRLGL